MRAQVPRPFSKLSLLRARRSRAWIGTLKLVDLFGSRSGVASQSEFVDQLAQSKLPNLAIFRRLSKNSPEIEPKVARYRVDPVQCAYRAELLSNVSACGVAGSRVDPAKNPHAQSSLPDFCELSPFGKFSVQGSWSMQTAGSLPGYPPQLKVRRSVSSGRTATTVDREFVSTSVKQSPVFFPPCYRAVVQMSLQLRLQARTGVFRRRRGFFLAALPQKAHYPSLSTSFWHVRRMVLYRSSGTPPAVHFPLRTSRPLSLSVLSSASDSGTWSSRCLHPDRLTFASCPLLSDPLSSRTRKWRFVQSRFSFVPHGTVPFLS